MSHSLILHGIPSAHIGDAMLPAMVTIAVLVAVALVIVALVVVIVIHCK